MRLRNVFIQSDKDGYLKEQQKPTPNANTNVSYPDGSDKNHD